MEKKLKILNFVLVLVHLILIIKKHKKFKDIVLHVEFLLEKVLIVVKNIVINVDQMPIYNGLK